VWGGHRSAAERVREPPPREAGGAGAGDGRGTAAGGVLASLAGGMLRVRVIVAHLYMVFFVLAHFFCFFFSVVVFLGHNFLVLHAPRLFVALRTFFM